MWGIIKKSILWILGIIALIFIAGYVYSYKNTRGQEYEKKGTTHEKTACEKYLDKLNNKITSYLLFEERSGVNLNWEDISNELEKFPPEEVKTILEPELELIRTNTYFIKELKEKVIKELEKILAKYSYNKERERWKSIHSDFADNPKLIEEWKIKGFSPEECQKWISARLKPDDFYLVYWLVKVKGGDYANPQKSFSIDSPDKISEDFIRWKATNDNLKENYLKNATIALDKINNSNSWQEVLSKYQSIKVGFSVFEKELEVVKIVNEIRKEFLMVCVDFCQKENEKEVKFNDNLKKMELRSLENFVNEGSQVNRALFDERKYDEYEFNKNILLNYYNAVMEEIERRTNN